MAERLDSPALAALVRYDASLVALAAGRHAEVAGLLAAALDEQAQISRPAARIHPERTRRRARRGSLEAAVRPNPLPRVVGRCADRTQRPSGGYTAWMQGDPDFPWPQRLRGNRAEGRVTISCQVSAIGFVWQLAEDGPGTRIDVHVALPDSEAHQLDGERKIITTSLAQLAILAKAAATS
ncbi:MAG: hypothetical protein ACRDRX_22150 [Pseudonocardiaceae bacterium]